MKLGDTLLPKPEQPLPIQALMLQDQLSFLLVALFAVFLAPVVEELLFRGFLFPVFERSHGSFVAILLTSAMFTALHGRQNAWQWQVLLGAFSRRRGLRRGEGRHPVSRSRNLHARGLQPNDGLIVALGRRKALTVRREEG